MDMTMASVAAAACQAAAAATVYACLVNAAADADGSAAAASATGGSSSTSSSAATPSGVREALPSDRAAIMKYTIDMADETEEDCTLDPVKVEKGVGFVLSGQGLSSKYWVATDDEDKVIGMVGVSPEWSDWWGVEYWWVISVYVEPSSRRRGVAARMMRGALAAAEAQGVQTVNLRVEKDNESAQALYRSVGFAVDPSHLVMACGRTPAGQPVGSS